MDYYAAIREKCLSFFREKEEKNIWEMAMACMDLEGLPMHCPPHHLLVPAVLLTACACKEGKTEEEQYDIAFAYAKDHIDEIPVANNAEYIPYSDDFEREDIDFEED